MSQDVIYEASANVKGDKSGVRRFVQNRSEESADAAKRGIRSEAHVRFPEVFRSDEDLEIVAVDVQEINTDDL